MLHKMSMQVASSQPNMFPLVSSCWKGFGNQELSSFCPQAEFCPGQSKASSDHSTELYQSRPVSVQVPGEQKPLSASDFPTTWQNLGMPSPWENLRELWCHLTLPKPCEVMLAKCIVIQAHASLGTAANERNQISVGREVGGENLSSNFCSFVLPYF